MSELYIERLSLKHVEDVLLVEQLSFADPWSRESCRYELVENELAYYYGCFMEQRLLGFGGFWQILTEGHITNVAVHPDFRSQGLGKLLVTHMMCYCRALGGTAMTLEVRQSNTAALALYSKFGFASVGVRPHYYDDLENAVIMWVYFEEKDDSYFSD